VFHYTIDGKGDIAVAAGHCSPPQIVNAGNHVITENLAKSTVNGNAVPVGFAFVSSTATGPLGDNRATSGTASNGGNPITVNVPYFSDPANGGETLVTFTNRVLRFYIKVCKVVDPGSLTPLAGDTFSGLAAARNLKGTVPWGPLTNGQCSGLLSPPSQNGWPVINFNGDPTSALVQETIAGPYFISAASVDNPWPGTSPPFIDHSIPGVNNVSWTPGVGVNVVTITNKYTPPN
jgi:hypothetical protein